MTIILSFDVGIINLAYCLFTKENNNWKILDWNIIDISERDEKKCHCGAKPSFIYLENYYCKIHCRTLEQTKEFNEIFKQLDKTNNNNFCKFIISEKECGKKTTFENETKFCFCTVHAKQWYKKYSTNNKIIEYKQKSVKKLDFDDIRLKLIQKLDNRKNLLTANIVVIENQPSMKNPVMKSISNTLYTYFMIRGIIDKQFTNSSINIVKFMSPSNKLKIVTEGENKQLVALKGTNEAKAYKLTKTLGIKYTKELLNHLPDWIKHLENFKKKDDLADAFLQGAYYYTKNL
jgi:hypothetical protein